MPKPGYVYAGQPGGRKVSVQTLRRYAQAYGLPAQAMAQIARGESGRVMNVQQRDPGDGNVGYTTFQFTPHAWGEGSAAMRKWRQLGGAAGVVDDLGKQFEMARFLYKSAGNSLSPWYGTKYLTDTTGVGTLGPINHAALASLAQGGRGQAVRAPRMAGAVDPGVAPTGTRPHSTTDARQAMLDSLLDPRKNMSLLDRFHERTSSGQYTTVVPGSINGGQMPKYLDPNKGQPHGQPGSPSGSVGQGGPRFQQIVSQANKIDAAGVPYLWGGGHQRRIGRGEKVTPMDCSGSVSRLLGINPMVASQFMKWGKKGRDPRGRFTVWAKADHVIVEIGGHFWGTSRSNPGGGAGWIPSSAISKSYLSAFTPRHFG